ncbi:MAG TPA: SRPBCC domain-containing protein [Miltoncostaeaceae bacterium]|nr:SRPBCC domain-containing protein [Miltoncostaeaceae bacterium]
MGPPTHPATVVAHDLRPGGKVSDFMTGPDGDRSPGWWRLLALDAPRRLEFDLGDRLPLEPGHGQLISMGFQEGMSSAIGQIDDVLQADAGPRW